MTTPTGWLHVEASHEIAASPGAIYDVVSDYKVGHPAILPQQYFVGGLKIEKGGKGAGTVLRGAVKVMGREFPFYQEVSEPEPGRVLAETDLDTGQYTEFIFEPVGDGSRTRVTISSDFPASPGLLGVIERWTKPGMIRDIYVKELRQLESYVLQKGAA
jgi:hypothetical protein